MAEVAAGETLYQKLKRENAEKKQREAASQPAPAETPAPAEEAVDPDLADAQAFDERYDAQAQAATQEATRFGEVAQAHDIQENPQQGPMPSGEVTAPTNAALPEFRLDIYDGMEKEDADALYQAYVKHADTTDSSVMGGLFGEVPTYKGKRILSPEDAKGQREVDAAEAQRARDLPEARARMGNIVSTGLSNALQSTEALGVAGVEKVAEVLTGSDLKWSESYAEAYPRLNTKKPEDQWLSDAVEMGVGAAAGAAVGGGSVALKAGSVARNLGVFTSKLATWGTRALATGLGTGVTYDKDKENWIVGPNGLMGGIDTTDEHTATNILKQRLNVVLDSTALALGGDSLLGGGQKILKLFGDRVAKPLYGLVSQTAREDAIVKNMMGRLYQITDTTTPEQMKAIKNEFITMLQDPKNLEALYGLKELGEAGYKRDTVSALEKGYEGVLAKLPEGPAGDAERERVGALLHGLRTIRSSVSKEGGATEGALLRPREELKGALRKADELGGTQIEPAAQAIQKEAATQGAEAELPMALAESEKASIEASRPTAILDKSGTVGAELKTGVTPEEHMFDREAASKKVISDVKEVGKSVEKTKDDLYAQIPATRGFKMNETSWNKTISEGINNYPDRVKEVLEATKGKFGETYKGLRDILNDEIDMARDNSNTKYALLKLKKEIMETQPNYMRKVAEETSNPIEAADIKAAVGSIDDAEAFFKEHVTKEFRRGIPKKLHDIDVRQGFNEPTAAVEKHDILQNAIKSEHSEEIDHLLKVAKTNPGLQRLGTERDLHNIALHDVASDLSVAIRDKGVGKLTSADIEKITAPYRQLLSNDPQQAAKLTKLKLELANGQKTLAQLEADIKGPLKKDLDKALTNIYEKQFSHFVGKDGSPLPNGYKSFVALLEDKQAVGKTGKGSFDAAVDAIKKTGDPLMEKGMKAAWAKHFENSIMSGGKVVPKAIEDALTTESNVLLQAEKLYGKDMAENFSKLLDEVHKAETGARVAAGSKSEFGFGEKAVKQASQKTVNLVYGRLSRRGAQISSIMSAIIDQMDTAEMRNTVLQKMLSEPDEMVKLLKRTSIKEATNAKQAVRNWLYGVTSGRGGDQEKTNRQTDEALK